jgi:thioesterase domain-containing protein
MDKFGLQAYLFKHIPLSQAMSIEVREASPEAVILSAPLGPNVNHQGTVFAGSASAVGLLSAWALLFVRLQSAGLQNPGVVANNTMTYYRPITGLFTATAAMIDTTAWQRFTATLKQNNRAKITLTSVLHCKGELVAELTGEFVALGE